MKKFLAILLVLTTCFALVACGKGGNSISKEDVIGDWEIVINAQDIFGAMKESSLKEEEATQSALGMFMDLETDAKICLGIKFEDSGSVSMSIDKKSANSFLQQLLDDYFIHLKNGGLKDVVEAAGQNYAELTDMLEAQGITIDEYIEAMREVTENSAESAFGSETFEDIYGEWTIEDNTIIIDSEDDDNDVNLKINSYSKNEMLCSFVGKVGSDAEPDLTEISINAILNRKQ